MIITEKQLLILYQTTLESLCFYESYSNPFSFSRDIRNQIIDQIIEQQSEKLVEVK